MKIFTYKILLYLCIILISINGYSETPPGPDAEPCPTCPQDVPINNDLTLLASAGLLLGTYIIYNHKQNKKRPV